ncbi:MAG: hypothetical protein J5J06_07490 [Phycisphaerae bacterium]|nr:hypothetical protein [Phycisphaerae bacterium]
MCFQDKPESPKRRLMTITVERPRCPRCGGVRLRKYRTVSDQGDGSALSWVRCMNEQCGYRFRLVQE